jgi:signal transduction histidine kinase
VALARRAASDQQVTSAPCGIIVETELSELIGSWDADRLERLLGNLLSNAVKYSPAGGDVCVTVGCETDAGRRWAAIRVTDQGIGIPAEDIPHVFEAFRRAGNVAGVVRGTGLGLAGAREVVEQHGGRIGVESREGHGSTFTVHIPLDDVEGKRDSRSGMATV